mgnify:FL=1
MHKKLGMDPPGDMFLVLTNPFFDKLSWKACMFDFLDYMYYLYFMYYSQIQVFFFRFLLVFTNLMMTPFFFFFFYFICGRTYPLSKYNISSSKELWGVAFNVGVSDVFY